MSSGNKNHDYNAREIEFIKKINKYPQLRSPKLIPLVVPFKFIRDDQTIYEYQLRVPVQVV